jgi:hypothetical protein
VVCLDAAPFVNLKSGGTLLVGGSNVPVTFVPLLADLQAGLAYVNIHTAAHGGGEIRGQLTQVSAVPETSTYAMLAAGLGVIGFVARRRKQGQAR